MGVATDLASLQLDPISVVARSHQLVLWSRLGRYDRADLDALLWRDRCLFEYWAHAAAIVCTGDYPIHSLLMRRYPKARHGQLVDWLADNQALRPPIPPPPPAGGPLPAPARGGPGGTRA